MEAEKERSEVLAIPVVVPADGGPEGGPAASNPGTPGVAGPSPEAGENPGTPGNGRQGNQDAPETLAFLAFKRLGYTAREARERLEAARRRLAGVEPEPGVQEILRAMLRA